jgi:CheY-like chemotaxis protein
MIQMILAEEVTAAMKRAGVLLDIADLNIQVVSDGRSLLDCLNEAPNFYHAVVMNYDLPEISGPECIRFIKQFHDRICVLVLSDSVEDERLEDLGGLGVQKKNVLDRSSDSNAFSAWIAFSFDEAGLNQTS